MNKLFLAACFPPTTSATVKTHPFIAMVRLTLPFAFVAADVITGSKLEDFIREQEIQRDMTAEVPEVEPWCFSKFQEDFYLGGTDPILIDKDVDGGSKKRKKKPAPERETFEDSIPLEGLRRLSPKCKDLMTVIKSKEEHESLIAFLDKLQGVATKRGEAVSATDIATECVVTTRKKPGSGNGHQAAKTAIQNWFNIVWSRGSGNLRLDRKLTELNALPHQTFAAYNISWPLKKKIETKDDAEVSSISFVARRFLTFISKRARSRNPT